MHLESFVRERVPSWDIVEAVAAAAAVAVEEVVAAGR